MIGKRVHAILFAIVLGAASAVAAVTPGWPTQVTGPNDIALPPLEVLQEPVVEAVPAPPTAAAMRTARIALLLPLRSSSLGAAAEAVRAGFMAAHAQQPTGIALDVIGTDGSAANALSAYQQAASSSDIVVGPLARSEVSAIAQSGMVRTPTLALGQPDAAAGRELSLPPRMMVIGLSVEDDARQVARMISRDKMVDNALVVTTNVAWQRRTANAFASQWRALGLTSRTVELQLIDGYLGPDSLLALRTQLQENPPQVMFLALDAGLAAQLRLAIGADFPMYGTSQLNPLTLDEWQLSQGFQDLEGIRLIDIPWQLQPDHAAVMSYPRAVAGEQRRGADLERLYALGIDAFRIAQAMLTGSSYLELDGVTGRLKVRYDNSTVFEREQQPAVYQEGKVVPSSGIW